MALEIADGVMEAAGKGERSPTVRKGARDYSTAVDFKVERAVRKFLKTETPGIPLIGEELSPKIGKFDLAWVLDPVDGTVNYSKGHPLYGVSVALVGPHAPLAAGISLPWLGRKYLAESGGGTYMNGGRVGVSGVDRLSESVIGIGDFPTGKKSREASDRQASMLGRLARKVLRIRMHGSAAVDMCLVADGSCEASITLSNRIWDIQSGVLLVREAGGIVVDREGVHHTIRSTTTIATTKALKDILLRAVG